MKHCICIHTPITWKSNHFPLSQKIIYFYIQNTFFLHRDEAVQMSGMPTTKNSIEMENHVFQKAKTKVRAVSLTVCY